MYHKNYGKDETTRSNAKMINTHSLSLSHTHSWRVWVQFFWWHIQCSSCCCCCFNGSQSSRFYAFNFSSLVVCSIASHSIFPSIHSFIHFVCCSVLWAFFSKHEIFIFKISKNKWTATKKWKEKIENSVHQAILVTSSQSTEFNQYWQECGIQYSVHLSKDIKMERNDGKSNEWSVCIWTDGSGNEATAWESCRDRKANWMSVSNGDRVEKNYQIKQTSNAFLLEISPRIYVAVDVLKRKIASVLLAVLWQ